MKKHFLDINCISVTCIDGHVKDYGRNYITVGVCVDDDQLRELFSGLMETHGEEEIKRIVNEVASE